MTSILTQKGRKYSDKKLSSDYSSHPKNRFWRVTAEVFNENVPVSTEEKKAFLLRNHIALWDVIAKCDIERSSDSSIKNVVTNDLSVIFQTADIEKIFVNGKTAEKYYNRYILPKTGIKAVCLPSTSPANASISLSKLIEKWKIISL